MKIAAAPSIESRSRIYGSSSRRSAALPIASIAHPNILGPARPRTLLSRTKKNPAPSAAL
jgi:hypothetical protein